jgi:hypothetical protein
MYVNLSSYEIFMSQEEEDKNITISLGTIARISQDALIILTVCGLFFGPLWYFNVQKPIADLSLRVDKLEKSQTEASAKINTIDKNVAVILEKITGLQHSYKPSND